MTSVPQARFWDLDGIADPDAIACTDGEQCTLTYRTLAVAVGDIARALAGQGSRQLGFLLCSNTPQWLVAYLGCLKSGHVPLLLPDDLQSGLLESLRATYQPAWVWKMPPDAQAAGPIAEQVLSQFMPLRQSDTPSLHPELGLLLSTSGSTGSPKLVRLAYTALAANAESICSYLGITSEDRALTTLPSSYSYGLSVINSHLAAGACMVMRNVSVLTRDFLQVVQDQQVTSLSGVPTWYQMLLRSGFDKADTPSLRTFTQAGGRLDERTKRAVLAMSRRKSARFFVMYGQTEASPRISYVPPEVLEDHLDSIGVAIPGGSLSLDPQSSEIIYEGPNVMMGYAESLGDLAKPDECNGRLRTGDVGEVDANGFFRVTGRLKRFIKLSGNRYGLDEIEAQLGNTLASSVAAVGRDDRLRVWIETGDPELVQQAKNYLQKSYQLHHSLYRVHLTDRLPLLSTGKKDYAALLEQLG
jgi:acyl-CoA synthetase (AMP-forming)/AMP-acid ligase II